MDYFDVLHAEFSKESDRAAVILTASIADELLRRVLIGRLVPVSSSSDDLFDGGNAPLSTFSSRIEMAYRVGIISVRFARDLHLIRKIRNEFAHNIHGCSFEDVRVLSRVNELNKSHGMFARSKLLLEQNPMPRDQFLQAAAWMIFHLDKYTGNEASIEPQSEEWGYAYCHDKKDEESPDTKNDTSG